MNKFTRCAVTWTHLRGIVLALGALSTGCAHSVHKNEVDELHRTIASLRAQNASYMREISELQNEIFILRDRVETREVAAKRKSAVVLPSVTLVPGESLPKDTAQPLYSTEVVTSPDGPVTIEYAGDAAVRSNERPVLRLVGDRGGVSIEHEAPPSPVAERPARAMPRPAVPPAQVPVVATERALARPKAAAPIALYRASLDQLSAGAHADAAAGFREFLRLYPTHDYADNAQYWLGEVYYDLKDYATAVREFRRVVENYPDGNKVPDALLKLGYAYLALGEDAAGRRTLQELVKSFREHPTARLADARLSAAQTGTAARREDEEVPVIVQSKETP